MDYFFSHIADKWQETTVCLAECSASSSLCVCETKGTFCINVGTVHLKINTL